MHSFKTIAVTGASGHVGNVLCRMLVARGYHVKALYHNHQQSILHTGTRNICGDVLNKSDLQQLMKDCDIVIHCAAVISINGDPTGLVFETNTKGPVLVLESAVEMGIKKIIHISSSHAVNELPHHMAFNEARPYKTRSSYVYDYSKAVGEQVMLGSDWSKKIETVVVRLTSVLGPYDFKPSELGKALLNFYHQKIPLLPTGGYNFIDVRDACSSIIQAIENGVDKEVYLLSGNYCTMKEFAAIIKKVTGKKTASRTISYKTLKASLPIVQWYSRISKAAPLYTIESIDALKNGHPNMDCSKAINKLGHHYRPLWESIRDFYEWHFSENKYDLKWI